MCYHCRGRTLQYRLASTTTLLLKQQDKRSNNNDKNGDHNDNRNNDIVCDYQWAVWIIGTYVTFFFVVRTVLFAFTNLSLIFKYLETCKLYLAFRFLPPRRRRIIVKKYGLLLVLGNVCVLFCEANIACECTLWLTCRVTNAKTGCMYLYKYIHSLLWKVMLCVCVCVNMSERSCYSHLSAFAPNYGGF